MISVVIGLVGLVIGFAGVLFAYYQLREARRIARSSGVLKAPQVTLAYGAPHIYLKNSNIQTIVYGMPPNSKDRNVGILRFLVQNAGTRAAENVKLQIVIPAGANRGGEFVGYGKERGILPGMSRECFRVKELLYVYYYLPIINPGEPISIEEAFWIETTVDARLTTVAPTLGKKEIKVELGFSFAFVFHLVLQHKEDLPLVTDIHVNVVEEDDLTKLANRWLEIEEKLEGPMPSNKEKKKQFEWVLKRAEPKKILLVLPKFKEIKFKKRSVSLEEFEKSERCWLTRTDGTWGLQMSEWRHNR